MSKESKPPTMNIKRQIADNKPNLVIPLVKSYTATKRLQYSLPNLVGSREHRFYSDPFEPRNIEIDPELVQQKLTSKFKTKDHQSVRGGSWDKHREKITEATEDSEEVTVAISRSGEVLLNTGFKEYKKAIDRDTTLEAKVVVRHKKWQKFRDEFVAFQTVGMGRNRSYNKVPHPDFTFNASKDTEARAELILDSIQQKGRLLDIGSHMGSFCHLFEKKGFNCVAVESKPFHFYFLKKFRDALNREFDAIEDSIFNVDIVQERFDVILALNIFHHFLKTENLYGSFLDLLKKLDAEVMVFQSVAEGEEQMENAYRRQSEDGLAEFIVSNSSFVDWEYLGTPGKDKRPIYKIHGK